MDCGALVKWIAVSAGVVLSLLIIAADAQFAAFGKRIVAEQIPPRIAQETRMWSNG